VTAPPPEEPRSTERSEAPIYKKWWFWTAIGVVAAGAVGGALLLGGTSNPSCPKGITCKSIGSP
jgi:hypothetical protein